MSWQTVSLPFGGGVDTKTDPKMTDPVKCNLLQDCIFTNPKRITKRNGYGALPLTTTDGQSLSNPTMFKGFKNEGLLASFASGNSVRSDYGLFSYSSTLSQWVNRGKYLSVSSQKSIISSTNEIGSSFGSLGDGRTQVTGCINSSAVVGGSYALYAYVIQGIGGCIAVVDLSTGTKITVDLLVTAVTSNSIKAVLLGASQLGVVAGGNLYLISVTTSGVTVGSAIPLLSGTPINFDWVNTSAGMTIAFIDPSDTSITIENVNTAGSITATRVITSALTSGNNGIISINVDSGGAFWVYWVDTANTSSESVFYVILFSTLAVVLGKSTVATGLASVSQICAAQFTSTSQQVFISLRTNVGSSFIIYNPTIVNYFVTNGGSSIGGSTFQWGVELYSKPVLYNGIYYLAVMFLSQTQFTGFLLDTRDGKPVAKFLPFVAEGLYSYSSSGLTYNSSPVFTMRLPGFLNTFWSVSPSAFLIGAGYVATETTMAVASGTAGPSLTALGAQMGVCGITLDFANKDAYQGVQESDSLILNGSIVSAYDGVNVSELNFNVSPDNFQTTQTTGSGFHISTGTYIYWSTYVYVDSNGNLSESSPSDPWTVVIGSGVTAGKVTATFQTFGLSTKILNQNSGSTLSPVSARLYRSLNNGTIGYLVAEQPIDFSQNTYSIVDGINDSLLVTSITLYTEGEAILPNTAPPPAMIMWANNGRIWVIDSENPETNIQYTKTFSPGFGLSFSFDQLLLVIDSRFGNISGAIAMDEKTVIFKDNGIFYFIGDGANDAGSGQSFTNPQVVPSDAGCSNSKSVILYPSGILFRASNNKGIYRFARNVQVTYFGYDVEQYNSQDIRSSEIVGNKNQIRFLTSSGNSLLYDYEMNQWSVFTNHAGISADLFNGVYTYIRSDGSIYTENQSTYLDNGSAISPIIVLSWIKAGSIQGFQRTRRVMLLGDYTGTAGHGVQISAAYDWDTNFSAPVSYIFNGQKPVYQYRERLSRQKCDAFQLKIQEITTGASGEYIDFTDLGLEIQGKQGLNKLPGSYSSGA